MADGGAREVLFQAIAVLAQHGGDRQHRLADAYSTHLAELDPREFSASARGALAGLRRTMTFAGSPMISARVIDDTQAEHAIASIVWLYDDISEAVLCPFAHARRRFWEGMRTLAESEGTVQERLGDAYIYRLLSLLPQELPAHLRAEFDRLCRLVSREPSNELDAIRATTQRMSTAEASELIARTIALYRDLLIASGGER
jgi:hypothetical protein